MAKPEVRVFQDLTQLSGAAASRFEDLARVKAIEKKTFSVALSGGSTPKVLYEILGSPAFAGKIRWQGVHLFQVDERCVPPDHPESNYRMIGETLLRGATLPEANFHRLAAEGPDHDRACREYAEVMARVIEPREDGWPRLDLVFLGMGLDGHTASLFPGTEALDEQVLWVRPNYVEKLKMRRLTMTLPVLNAAANVIFLVAGTQKAGVLRQVLEGPPGQLPAQRIQPVNGYLSWYVDEDAAGFLSRL